MATLPVGIVPITGKTSACARVIDAQGIDAQKWALDVAGLVAGLIFFMFVLLGVSRLAAPPDSEIFNAGADARSPSLVGVQP